MYRSPTLRLSLIAAAFAFALSGSLPAKAQVVDANASTLYSGFYTGFPGVQSFWPWGGQGYGALGYGSSPGYGYTGYYDLGYWDYGGGARDFGLPIVSLPAPSPQFLRPPERYFAEPPLPMDNVAAEAVDNWGNQRQQQSFARIFSADIWDSPVLW